MKVSRKRFNLVKGAGSHNDLCSHILNEHHCSCMIFVKIRTKNVAVIKIQADENLELAVITVGCTAKTVFRNFIK